MPVIQISALKDIRAVKVAKHMQNGNRKTGMLPEFPYYSTSSLDVSGATLVPYPAPKIYPTSRTSPLLLIRKRYFNHDTRIFLVPFSHMPFA